jgi:general stress protein YciG
MNKKETRAYFSALGSKGGKKTARKYGKEHMAKIGRKGAYARIKVLTKKDIIDIK